MAALNRLALSDDPAAPALWDAVETVQTAGDADFRAAVVGLRDAMAAAIEATLTGIGDERPEDRGDLTTALQAIVGDDEALAALTRGRLEEVPAAGLGGFGAVPLGAAPATDRQEPPPRRKPKLPAARGARAEAKPAPAAAAPADDKPDGEVDDTLARRRAEKQAKAAAAAAEKAERTFAAAEAEAEAAADALTAAEARVADAQAALEQAESEQEAAASAATAADDRLVAARAAAEEAAAAHEAAVADLAALD